MMRTALEIERIGSRIMEQIGGRHASVHIDNYIRRCVDQIYISGLIVIFILAAKENRATETRASYFISYLPQTQHRHCLALTA